MITELEYITEREGVRYALRADKNVKQRNAWHLSTISGNGMPPASANGGQSYGIAGRSYNGLTVDGREIEAEVYADGHDPIGCQRLLSAVPRIVSTDNEALGVLRLANAAGEWFRIPAKCTAFDVETQRRRSALCSAVFDCPYPYFESDVLHIAPFYAVKGGKEWPLERPYTFGNIDTLDADGNTMLGDSYNETLTLVNEGDVAAPCVIRIYGAGMEAVEITNQTTGAAIIVANTQANGLEISTDPNDLYARFDDGRDASAYVSLFSDISAFNLRSGVNQVNVKMTATRITEAGTQIEWRGRFTTCL